LFDRAKFLFPFFSLAFPWYLVTSGMEVLCFVRVDRGTLFPVMDGVLALS